MLSQGDEIHMDNSDYVAVQTYHRHQVHPVIIMRGISSVMQREIRYIRSRKFCSVRDSAAMDRGVNKTDWFRRKY